MKKHIIIEEIKDFVFKKTPHDDIHGYGHTERVYQMCIELGKKLEANLFVLKAAALLHDIGRFSNQSNLKNKNHAEISVQIASDFLESLKFQIRREEFENILHCIQTHSFSNRVPPKTLEAKILSDVDKLDALGAIGLYRTIGYTTKMKGGLKDVLEHLESKIFKLKSQLILEITKKYAQDRLAILNQFYVDVKKELKMGKS